MSIKKGNQRISIALDQKHLEKLNRIKAILNIKNNQKIINFLIDVIETESLLKIEEELKASK